MLVCSICKKFVDMGIVIEIVGKYPYKLSACPICFLEQKLGTKIEANIINGVVIGLADRENKEQTQL